ncbi:hypothetical protein GCM10010982_01860 [Bowmanella pacifica]|uniref:GIY-YIG domain-containing protein n=2 Tax=Bowmanella pacifica TaxID=502051 RepID=A0A917YQ92_9ALTE|nr:hypothetical protein GCM10010982_01860 [Bowmanella pacifica]
MTDTPTDTCLNTSSTWYLYMIENRLGQWYTGISTDPQRRFTEHQSGGKKAAKALRGKAPLVMRYCQSVGDRAQASRFEYQLKRLSKADKLRLAAGQLSLAQLGG